MIGNLLGKERSLEGYKGGVSRVDLFLYYKYIIMRV